ncbi:MAG TPA: hypothetical protein VMV29_02530 [Ktedonobacterales bacterium]|nr:hypothetical protein [Ktedonobacterales bacterium]
MLPPLNTPDVIQALTPVVEALESVGAQYFVGGSVASSIHGRSRATQDVDIVTDLALSQVHAFVQRLQNDYYIAASMIQDAIRYQSSFNLLHNDTGVKVDVFIKKAGLFAQQEMQRAKPFIMAPGIRPFVFASPEDIILAKLDWWIQGGSMSSRQWSDIVEVIRRQQAQLDVAYLRQTAPLIRVVDALEQALTDAKI